MFYAEIEEIYEILEELNRKAIKLKDLQHRINFMCKDLRKMIRKSVGKPCKQFHATCPSCELYLALHRIENFYEDTHS